LEQKVIGGIWVLKFICGAALIWPSVVVTAAHCVKGKEASHLIIRLGEWDTQTTNELLPYQVSALFQSHDFTAFYQQFYGLIARVTLPFPYNLRGSLFTYRLDIGHKITSEWYGNFGIFIGYLGERDCLSSSILQWSITE